MNLSRFSSRNEANFLGIVKFTPGGRIANFKIIRLSTQYLYLGKVKIRIKSNQIKIRLKLFYE
jgi:hypothetical protein